jgi:hypothetical protein
MSKTEKFIPVKEFVRRLEEFSVDFYKNCLLKTNQYSTKYILQQAIKSQQNHNKDIILSPDLPGEEEVDTRHLENIMDNFSRNYVDDNFELDNLNFVEATHLAILLMEYVIAKYQILMKCKLSGETIKSLNDIYQMKQNQLETMKKEYEKRRYK